jgi:hypothetical protein
MFADQKISLLAMLLISQLGATAAADPAPDWAKDAVDTLQQRDILQGYPEGERDGGRAATRNELAELIERLDQERLESEATFSTELELDETRRQAGSVSEQIESLDARVQNLEQSTDRLDQRQDQTVRPRF